MSGDIETTAPVILIDTREKRPLPFDSTIRTKVKCLKTGDYTIEGYEGFFAVERKSIPDLIGTLTAGRDRFERELQRMTAFRFRRVIVEGSLSQVLAYVKRIERDKRRRVRVNSIIGTIYAFEVRYGVPFTFAARGAGEAAWIVEHWARYFVREQKRLIAEIASHYATGNEEP